ncbi:hypothetical protein GC173_01310 [bacterium]|nr:hypothetical protein [bacterium]
MKPDAKEDELIRRGFAAMDPAPEASHFAARVIAAAAVTPQEGRTDVLPSSPVVLWLMRSGGAALGLVLGLAFMLVVNSSTTDQQAATTSASERVALIDSLTSFTIDPVESFAAQLAAQEAKDP